MPISRLLTTALGFALAVLSAGASAQEAAIREALATLTTLRVLESRPNSGIYLRRVSTDSSFETLVMLADLGETPAAIESSIATIRPSASRLRYPTNSDGGTGPSFGCVHRTSASTPITRRVATSTFGW